MTEEECKSVFKYYHSLELDVFSTEPYVAIDADNFKSFSIFYNKSLISICNETDMIMKLLCKTVNPDFKGDNIKKYCSCIQSRYGGFNNEEVLFESYRISLAPWKNWTIDNTPEWWRDYTMIKHQRLEFDENGIQHFKKANLHNVLSALSALYITLQYLFYENELASNPEGNAGYHPIMLICKSAKLSICNWKKCYSFFSGSMFFDLSKLKTHIDPK